MRDTRSRVKRSHHMEPPLLDDHRLHELIARRAYELFLKRGRENGHECEDWLEAEREILVELEPESVTISRPLAKIHGAA